MKKWIMSCFLGLTVLLVASAEITVSNLKAEQRPGTKMVDITYDVEDTDSNLVQVNLIVRNGASRVNCPTVSGAVGAVIATGIGKKIVWDAGADWGGQVSEQMIYSLEVDTFHVPGSMVLIPAGTNSGTDPDFGAYSLTVSAFYMDKYQVTKAKWDEVYTWAVAHGYSFDNDGSGKAANHPVHTVNWYDCVKWCNARSQKEGRPAVYTVSGAVYKTGRSDNVVQTSAAGYRLPTDIEWEYAARGGLTGKRFPWGDTIQHARANYKSNSSYSYDTSPTHDYHPTYATGGYPYTSPVGAFAPNDYGLYDMAGNVWERCFDWHPDSVGSYRVYRGGCWDFNAYYCRAAFRINYRPDYAFYNFGFRAVLPPGQ